MPDDPQRRCLICGGGHSLTFHHLIPRTCHSNKWFKKHFDKEDMRERGIIVCRRCHSYIHQQFSAKQLGRELNTLQKLLRHEKMQAFFTWVRRHR